MIAVVGAGLAGLTCAKVLHQAGRNFVLIEQADTPGGRVRHRREQGFTLDAGFHVILDSYSTLRRHVDLDALDRRYFDSGAIMWDEGKFFDARSPVKHPGAIFSDLSSPAFSFADKVKLTSLVSSLLFTSDNELLRSCSSDQDESTRQHLEKAGYSEEFIRRFVQPFFGGVFLDNELTTSRGLFWYYLKKFATGQAFVPAGGMGALPTQLAAQLDPAELRLSTSVTGFSASGNRVSRIEFAESEPLEVNHLVLATDEPSTRRLLNLPGPTRPSTSVSSVYLTSTTSAYPDKLVVLPGGHDRLVRHFVQMTNIAPEYAPPGQHLISATVLDHRGLKDTALFEKVIAEVSEAFPRAASHLRPLAIEAVPYAMPCQPPGFATYDGLRSPYENVLLAGDQTTNCSSESAMRSGERAAQELLNQNA